MARPTGPTDRGPWRRAAAAVTAVVAVVGLPAACQLRQRSVDAFCDELRAVEDLDEVLSGAKPGSVAERASQLQRLHLAAPEEIEAEVERLASVTDDLVRTMATTPDPDSAATEVFSRRSAELPEITTAGRAIEDFAAQRCSLVLNPTSATPPE